MKSFEIKQGRRYRGKPRNRMPSPEVRQVLRIFEADGIEQVQYRNQKGKERTVRLSSFASWAFVAARKIPTSLEDQEPTEAKNRSFFLSIEDQRNLRAIMQRDPNLSPTSAVSFGLALAAGIERAEAREQAIQNHRKRRRAAAD